MRYEILMLITCLIIVLYSVLALFNQGLWWDEAVYLSLGRSILHGSYSLNDTYPVESFRPPLFPLILSLFSWSVTAGRVFSILLSLAAIVSLYMICREVFGREHAHWSLLLFVSNPWFIFFAGKILTEMLFISLVSLSLLVFFRYINKGDKKYLVILGFLSGLCFLTKYFGWIVIVSYLLCLLFRKRDDVLPYMMFLVITLLPWFMMNVYYYENPLGSLYINWEVYSKAALGKAGLEDLFIFLGLLTFLIPFYFFRFGLKKEHMPLWTMFFISMMVFVLLPYREIRYFLSFLPVYVILGVTGFLKFMRSKKILSLIVIICCVATSLVGLNYVWLDRDSAKGLVEACVYLKSVTKPNETIMTESYPYVKYIAERSFVKFPTDSNRVTGLLRDYNIRYVLVYRFEPGNPEYVNNYFTTENGFEPVRNFSQWGRKDAVTIYRFLGNFSSFLNH